MGLFRLTVVVIDNHSSTYGWTDDIEGRFKLEGWSGVTVDGRDHAALQDAFSMAHPESPHVVVATIESKG